ncbi:response regulator [Methylocaldum szegediense]|uniref:response regulator n=1 Tax=Methylocaldum szegediense TaxID=73780 RepID=UPI0003FCB95E|nr:response regulator [Methylocaldum szegediense]
MTRFEKQQSLLVNTAIVISLAIAFVGDILTPQGVAVWALYFIPVALTLFVWRQRIPILVALAATILMLVGRLLAEPSNEPLLTISGLNKVLGVLSIWAVTVVARQSVGVKLQLKEDDWIRSGQRDLSLRMQGEQSFEVLCDKILRFFCEYLDVPVGVLYAAERDGGELVRMASYAVGPDSACPDRIAPGEGLVGQAVKERRVLRFDNLPDGYLRMSLALGEAAPRHLVVMPAVIDGKVKAVIELGFLSPVGVADTDLLSTMAEPVASAIRSSLYRTRLEDLLRKTQRQADELQRQKEELRAANEELKRQGKALSESEVRLEAQNEELTEINVRLEEQRDELSRAQEELMRRSEELVRANRYKSEFLANMSHELRTPLNSALILAKLLADNKDGNLTPEQAKYASIIYSSGNDLLELINDILDLSRIEAGRLEMRPEPVELGPLVETLRRSFQPIASQKNLAFKARIEPGTTGTITSDPLRLQQILRNLLSNACKFTERGEVSLRVVQAGADRISFAVRDTGIGIPPEHQDAIFEAFRQADGSTQRKHGGTGLGLTISKELAHRLGGEILVESAPRKGSTFTLVLPVEFARPAGEEPPREAEVVFLPGARSAAEKPAPGPEKPARESAGGAVQDDRESLAPGDRSILVIEDDQAFAGILRDLAREMRFRCLVATTAGAGLALAEQFLPSAIILDIHLPDHSGLCVLEHLKGHAATRHIPVHVISISDYTQQALEMGAVGYALKPVMREQLVSAFRKLEQKLEQNVRRVLVVEDVAAQRESIERLLRTEGVEVVSVGAGSEALKQLKEATFDCVVLDLSLPDISGYDLLDKMASGEAFSFPPVIVYTGRTLTREEERRLRRYASTIIVKGARSPERLLDEVTLFLHQVEARLPREHQDILRELRSREGALEGRTILVVEDDVRNIFAISSVLEPKGAKVRVARNGKEALEVLERSKQEPGAQVDLVLMDIMMPEMDGLTATREIRKHPEWKELPIIAITAKAMPDDRAICIQAGANDYIAKPIDTERLVSLVKVWMPK